MHTPQNCPLFPNLSMEVLRIEIYGVHNGIVSSNNLLGVLPVAVALGEIAQRFGGGTFKLVALGPPGRDGKTPREIREIQIPGDVTWSRSPFDRVQTAMPVSDADTAAAARTWLGPGVAWDELTDGTRADYMRRARAVLAEDRDRTARRFLS